MFQTNLNEISKGRFKSEEQKRVLENIKLLYKSQQVVIKVLNELSSVASDAKYKTKYRDGLKTLTLKQMFQRLPIALVQVKPGSTSENFFNEIRQIIYSLYRAK